MSNYFTPAAEYYASLGIPVLPLHIPGPDACSCGQPSCGSVGKHPRHDADLLPHGLNSATTDPDLIARWGRRWPNSNIGLVTGSLSGLVVLDIDIRHGGDAALAALIEKHGPLPNTCTCSTGGGGKHFYFRHPGGLMRNSAGLLGTGIDIRADGGYAVAPPSCHASGTYYGWDPGRELLKENPLAPLPVWVVDATAIPQRHATTARSVTTDPLVELVLTTTMEGGRNDALTRVAGLLFRALPARAAAELARLFADSHLEPPLTVDEVTGVLESIARREAEKLRRRAGKRNIA